MLFRSLHRLIRIVLPYLSRLRRIWRWLLLPTFLILCLLSFVLINFIAPVDLQPSPGSRLVLAADGTPMRAFADEQGVWRYPITLDDVSPFYVEALIHYEDRYFYLHPGVNPVALMRALWQWLRNGEIISGGSTLTMQVARMRYPEPRTLWGKAKEVVRALQLDAQFNKAEILTYYLNHAPFGGTIEGVQAAALTYFGYGAENLTPAQAALLAVLPQAPTRYRPDRNPLAAEAARNKLIDRLVSQEVWQPVEAEDAKQESVIAIERVRYLQAPLLARRLALSSTDALITTTIDASWQRHAEQLLQQYVQTIAEGVSAAVLIVDSATGAVKVYAGSADFNDATRAGHVDMVSAIRSPGSTLKPFIYGLAIDAGLIHSESLLMNVPLRFADYQPQNFSGGFSGVESVADSLATSLNVPAVQVLERLGPVALYLALQQGGAELRLPGNSRPSLAIALGGLGTNLESLVQLFSGLDNDGETVVPRFTKDTPIERKPLLSAGSAWIIRKILRDSANSEGLAVKTGTSYGFRDSWAVAVADGYSIGVWVGKPDGTPLTGHFGRQTAVPLLRNILEPKLRNNEMPRRPDSVSAQTICWPSGQIEPEALCDESRQAWLLDGLTPATWMTVVDPQQLGAQSRKTLRLSVDSQLQAPFGCDLAVTLTARVLWPLPVQHWLPEIQQTATRLPLFDPRCPKQLLPPAGLPLAIGGIREGDAVALSAQQQATIELNAEGGQAPYYWYLNGQLQSEQGVSFSFSANAQHHYDIVLMDYAGQLDRRQFSAL